MTSFRIRQNNQTVVSVDGKQAEAERTVMSYAMQYRADGDVTVQHNAEGHWKRLALFTQWPLPKAEAGQ